MSAFVMVVPVPSCINSTERRGYCGDEAERKRSESCEEGCHGKYCAGSIGLAGERCLETNVF